ncbi:DNA cytosine methyltransferase [Herbidospora yilanensis]|uniref:DNA cytosine methyltransferase n=1 Tax=Herbidospora yilanensis TaxID=354426 RepID=UPI000780EFE5|nr:DNA cytosine methyltransferase [Herbidospora yilanensis]
MTRGPSRRINVVDLFAGCGGFTQGFHEFVPDGCVTSPYRTVGAVEFNLAAASTFAANFAASMGDAGIVYPGDIVGWTPDMVSVDVDVILGGPPCQGFSGLGKGDPNDPRNRLWREYVRVVRALRPGLFIVENVDRFLRSVEYELLLESTAPGGDLSEYVIETTILNAADYGVPQTRRRVIVIATHRDLVVAHPEGRRLGHPAPTHRYEAAGDGTADLRLFEVMDEWVPAGSVFTRTPAKTESTQLPEGRKIDLLGTTVSGTFRTTELHVGRAPTELSLARYAAIPPGGNRHDLPPDLSTESWMTHNTGSGDVMGRLRWNQPSVTIRTEFFKPEKGRYLHPVEDRPITHLEAALLQGFPEDFLWCGSKVDIARQIGNAVPVGMAKAIAAETYKYLLACRVV